MATVYEGRAWVFREPNIDTDLIMPKAGFGASREERLLLALSALRPGWAAQVRPGDVLVAGRNFGTGSSRPAAHHLRELGLIGIVAESMNDLFLRNCVNSALPALDCPGVLEHVSEGDRIQFDIGSGRVENVTTGTAIFGAAMPQMLVDIIEAGGVFAQLRAAGFM